MLAAAVVAVAVVEEAVVSVTVAVEAVVVLVQGLVLVSVEEAAVEAVQGHAKTPEDDGHKDKGHKNQSLPPKVKPFFFPLKES